MKIMLQIIIAVLIGNMPMLAQWERISDELWGSMAEKVIGTDKVLYATARQYEDYYSTDKGFTWTKMGAPPEIVILNAMDDYVFAKKGEVGLIISSDRGKTWLSEKNILTDSVVSTVSFFKENVYAITKAETCLTLRIKVSLGIIWEISYWAEPYNQL